MTGGLPATGIVDYAIVREPAGTHSPFEEPVWLPGVIDTSEMKKAAEVSQGGFADELFASPCVSCPFLYPRPWSRPHC